MAFDTEWTKAITKVRDVTELLGPLVAGGGVPRVPSASVPGPSTPAAPAPAPGAEKNVRDSDAEADKKARRKKWAFGIGGAFLGLGAVYMLKKRKKKRGGGESSSSTSATSRTVKKTVSTGKK